MGKTFPISAIETRVCRVCHGHDAITQLLKYDVRHYAHYRCFANRFGKAAILALPVWKLRHKFPYIIMREAGITDEELYAVIGAS